MKRGPKEFSWFTYRETNPAMRDQFMGPRTVLRVKEVLLSVLAGDIFGKTPFRPSLLVFKAIYHAASLASLKRSFAAWQRRRMNMRPDTDAQTAARP